MAAHAPSAVISRCDRGAALDRPLVRRISLASAGAIRRRSDLSDAQTYGRAPNVYLAMIEGQCAMHGQACASSNSMDLLSTITAFRSYTDQDATVFLPLPFLAIVRFLQCIIVSREIAQETMAISKRKGMTTVYGHANTIGSIALSHA